MKKIIFLSSLLLNSAAFANFYCPDSVFCDDNLNKCRLAISNPDYQAVDWQVEVMPGKKIKDSIYNFHKAVSSYHSTKPYASCEYKGGSDNVPTIILKAPQTANLEAYTKENYRWNIKGENAECLDYSKYCALNPAAGIGVINKLDFPVTMFVSNYRLSAHFPKDSYHFVRIEDVLRYCNPASNICQADIYSGNRSAGYILFDIRNRMKIIKVWHSPLSSFVHINQIGSDNAIEVDFATKSVIQIKNKINSPIDGINIKIKN